MANFKDGLSLLPEHMRDGVVLYIEHGVPGGGFMMAVMENDLKGAFARADYINKQQIDQWVAFIYNYAPSACHGSPEIVNKWISHGGLSGLAAERKVAT